MMRSILKIYIGLAFLAIYVHGIGYKIKEVIEKRELIDGIFRPTNKSEIGKGARVRIFKGVNMIDNSDVALKFCFENSDSEREYEMYSYLKAIDNPQVEKFGISPIYYHNKYGNYSLTVFSLFECDLHEKLFKSNVPFQTIDYLILFRDFVRQSKYIHSKGIRHNDIKPENIMIRKGRSFLIDFNRSTKMNEFSVAHTIQFSSRRFHQQHIVKNETSNAINLQIPIDDWESFLYTIAYMLDVELEWFNTNRGYFEHMLIKMFGPKKDDTSNTIKQIKKDVKCEHLKEIMVEFAKEAFKEDGSLPRYNYFDKLITKKIGDVNRKGEPAIFSWLMNDDHARNEAIMDLRDNPPATAKEIVDPKATFRANDYKKPDYDYFVKCRDKMAQNAKGNHQHYLKEQDEKDLKNAIDSEKKAVDEKKEKKKQEKKKNMSFGKKIASKIVPRKHG